MCIFEDTIQGKAVKPRPSIFLRIPLLILLTIVQIYRQSEVILGTSAGLSLARIFV
jgi:hypothetical protein